MVVEGHRLERQLCSGVGLKQLLPHDYARPVRAREAGSLVAAMSGLTLASLPSRTRDDDRGAQAGHPRRRALTVLRSPVSTTTRWRPGSRRNTTARSSSALPSPPRNTCSAQLKVAPGNIEHPVVPADGGALLVRPFSPVPTRGDHGHRLQLGAVARRGLAGAR